MYLNTGTAGLIPRSILKQIGCLAKRFFSSGPARPDVRSELREAFDLARENTAQILGAQPEEVAFLENTTEGINAVVHGLGLGPGDEVVVTDLEHPAGRITWEFLARRMGIVPVVVAAREGRIRARDIIEAFSPRTRVLSISHVGFTTGQVFPVDRACRAARERGIFSILDGAQGVGLLDFSPRDLGCDAYAFPGYKWLLGAEGSGGLWVRREAWDRLAQYRVASRGTRKSEMDGFFEPWPGPRKFESSTIGPFPYIAMGLGSQYLMQLGLDSVERHSLDLSRRFIDGLSALAGIQLVTPPDERSGLVSFTVQGVEPPRVVDQLWEEHRIVLRSVPRPHALRVSFHLYNNVEDVQTLLLALGSVKR